MRTIKIILICILILISIQNLCLATSTIDTNINIGETNAINSSKNFTENILGYMQVIGSIVSVAALAIIGIRYMISSVEEKAEMKGVLIYYIIGAVLVFATTQILGVLFKVISNVK